MAHGNTRRDSAVDTHGARMRIPRSRGAVSGLLLLLLGAWGALAPLIGPYVHFGYTPDTAWHLSSGRFWLEILPGAVAALGGFLLLTAANRIATLFGAWLGVAAGAWFIIGTTIGTLVNFGGVGSPIATSKFGKAMQFLLLFDGLGALIIFVAATALGRLGVISVRDVEAARRRDADRLGFDDNRSDDNHFDDNASIQRSVREVPAVQTPVVEKPVVEKPVVQQPVVERNVVETTVERPVVERTPIETPAVQTSREVDTDTDSIETDARSNGSTSRGGATRITKNL